MSETQRTRIIGIDPGYDRVGWCVLEQRGQNTTILASGLIQTKKTEEIAQRYIQITQQLTDVLQTYHPTECGIESVFFSNNAKSAMRVSEAKGCIIGVLLAQKVAIFEYTPPQIKNAITGNGNATKQEVEKMVRLLTKCEQLPKLDDEIDAIAIALTHQSRRSLIQRIQSQ